MAPSMARKLINKVARKRASATSSTATPSTSLSSPNTANNATSITSSISRVVGITELLEHVLLHLEAKDLLKYFRVSLQFHATICHSIKLRETLCLEMGLAPPPHPLPTFVQENALLGKKKLWTRYLCAKWTSYDELPPLYQSMYFFPTLKTVIFVTKHRYPNKWMWPYS